MATFVLVHGAFVGAWCWRWVTPLLRAAGHDVHTPTLTGLGERVHLADPAVGLETHIADIVNVLRHEDLRDVVLVGWSYGGMVVTGAADRSPERLARLVYLDADAPADGDTSAPLSSHQRLARLADAHGDGWRVPAEVTRVPGVLLGELSDDRREWISARLVPHPLRTWTQPIRLTGNATRVPTTYIRCMRGYDPEDEDTARQDARIASQPTWDYVELAETHAVPLTAERVLAEALIDLT